MWRGLIEEYRSFLPVTPETPVVTLMEGNTPLLPAQSLSQAICAGRLKIFLKLEGLNPTGSFKDRGMTMAISKARGAWFPRRHLRFDREYLSLGCGVRRAGRPPGLRRPLLPARQDRARESSHRRSMHGVKVVATAAASTWP